MVPKNFDWKKYSRKHGLTEKRFMYIMSFLKRYEKLKRDYEDCYNSSRITSYDIFPKRRYVESHIEANAIRAANLKVDIDLIENAARVADYKLAPFILKYLTTECSFKDIMQNPELNGDEEYFEKCWRYCVCLIDMRLRERENHNL